MIFRSCEALVLRLVEASPRGLAYIPLSATLINTSRPTPRSSSGSRIASLFLLLRLCAWFGLYPTSRGPRRFFTIAVLLNVIAIRTPETVRYDLTWSTSCLLRKTPELDDRFVSAILIVRSSLIRIIESGFQ